MTAAADASLAFLETVSDNTSTDETPAEPSTQSNEPQGVKPAQSTEKPKPESTEDAARKAAVELSERQRKIDAQVQANRRQKAELDRTRAEIEAQRKSLADKERELDEAWNDPAADWERRAKKRNVPVSLIHSEYTELIKNGGKPSRDMQTARELEALKRERDEEKKALQELEEQQAQQAEQAKREEWGNTIDEMLGYDLSTDSPAFSDSAKSSWPRLTAQPWLMVKTSIISLTKDYISETGNLPDQKSLLDFLERQLPEAATAPPPAKTKPRATVPSDRDASGIPDKRTKPQTQQERDQAALDFLNSLPD